MTLRHLKEPTCAKKMYSHSFIFCKGSQMLSLLFPNRLWRSTPWGNGRQPARCYQCQLCWLCARLNHNWSTSCQRACQVKVQLNLQFQPCLIHSPGQSYALVYQQLDVHLLPQTAYFWLSMWPMFWLLVLSLLAHSKWHCLWIESGLALVLDSYFCQFLRFCMPAGPVFIEQATWLSFYLLWMSAVLALWSLSFYMMNVW